MTFRRAVFLCAALVAVPCLGQAQSSSPGWRGGLSGGYAQEGSITRNDPTDAQGRHYVEYALTDLNAGDSVKIGVVAAGFRARVHFREPGYSLSNGVLVSDEVYAYSLSHTGQMTIRITADRPGDTGKYKVTRLYSGYDFEMPEPNSRVHGVHIGANLHNSNVQLEDDEFAWVGAGYAVRAALGFSQHLVLHAEMQNALLDPDDDAPTNLQDEIWEFKDYEVGARLYMLSGLSYFRPYLTGAYAFRKLEPRSDAGYKGNAFVVGGGLEFFFLESVTLELGATYSTGNFDRIYVGDEERDVADVLGEESFKVDHRRISFGVAWHPSF